jgi:2-polyprenyl-3-methyl-5-hydroxy-6-metoxy-1,4-benzoquinol methylase
LQHDSADVGFDPRRYWDRRLSANYSLAGVGYLGLGGGFNRWAYRVRRRVFLRAVRRHLDSGPGRVLDVGSGTGFYLDRWHELGATEIAGSDLTATAVDALRRNYPRLRIDQLDIGAEQIPIAGGFDWISAMDVLFHLVDDEAYQRAFRNLAGLLRPGGAVVFSDFFAASPVPKRAHLAVRTSEECKRALRAANLELVSTTPLLALLNEPAGDQGPLLRRWWSLTSRLSRRRPRAGTAIAAIAFPVELALVSMLRAGPSTHLAVCRRPD